MKTINELLEIRNALVSDEEQVELYDVMDACESEEQAIDFLLQEIENLKNA